MAKPLSFFALLGATAALGAALVAGHPLGSAPAVAATEQDCPNEPGLSLPPGFCATIFADNVGHARHMAVAADGTVYVNTWYSRYFRTPPPAGGFIVALRDTDGDGKADRIDRFGTLPVAGVVAGGGTGIAIWRDGLYAEVDDRIVRYQLNPGERVPSAPPVVVLDGLSLDGDHMMHGFAIDAQGNLFVNSGSASNTCEKENRQPGSMGQDPCPELATRGGIWRYRADATGQHFGPDGRYATGIRNTGGIAFDAAGHLFAMQHGRDQLSQSWPALYTTDQGVRNPAEELLRVEQGDDYGWPYCYFDGTQRKLVLAPEYGGDGGHAIGRCADKKGPVATYPAHFAPTGLTYYAGGAFPAPYHGGLFIAFHGSWNRAPEPQDGYRIEFQPMADGAPSGPSILFADGFTGPGKASGKATNRPTGVTTGPDGALYVSDDVNGRIYRIAYKGPANASLAAASPVTYAPQAAAPADGEGGPAVPPGFTADQVALGQRIYSGQARSGTCAGCHGADGKGSTLGPALTGPDWLWTDGSVASIAHVIHEGVVTPKHYPTGMPANGGAQLSDADVQALAAYVWTFGHKP